MENDKEIDEELEKIRRNKIKKMMDKPKKTGEPESPILKPGENLIQLNASNFWEVIRKNERVLVDCYADWCGPCKMLEPIFTQLAKNHLDIVFGRLNIDYTPKIAAQFQIHAIPLVLFFKRGQLLNRLLGVQPYNIIEASIQKFMISS